jgi:flavin reductase (DIM6/NTAB) family NADH-FMN oxidoreductase RutF
LNYDPDVAGAHGLQLDPFKALVAPRPIGWISTISAEGLANLAPYSFFNAFATEPYYLAFGSGGVKDTLANIQATGEFVVNIASEELAQAMNATAATVVGDEFTLAGLAKAPSVKVKVPRVAASPASFECRHFQTVPLPNDAGEANDFLVIGRVVQIHLDERFVEAGRVNTAAMRLLSRLGYLDYATIDKSWRMERPA